MIPGVLGAVAAQTQALTIFSRGSQGATFFESNYNTSVGEDWAFKELTPTSPLWGGEPYITEDQVVLYAPHNGRSTLAAQTPSAIDFGKYSKCEVSFELGGTTQATASRPVRLRLRYSDLAPSAGSEDRYDGHVSTLSDEKTYTDAGTYTATFDISGVTGSYYVWLRTDFYYYGQWFKITRWRLIR